MVRRWPGGPLLCVLAAWAAARCGALVAGPRRGACAQRRAPPVAGPRAASPSETADSAALKIGLSAGGVVAVALNHLLLAGELPQGAQSRADLVAVAAFCGLVLEGLAERDVASRLAEVADLRGVRGRGLSADLGAADKDLLGWAAEALLTGALADRAVTLVVWTRDRGTLLRQGILGDEAAPDPAKRTFRAALDKAPEPTYIPDLQAVPARPEFLYLPRRTPSALVQPLKGGRAALVLACNRKRALSPRDLAWIAQVGRRLEADLEALR